MFSHDKQLAFPQVGIKVDLYHMMESASYSMVVDSQRSDPHPLIDIDQIIIEIFSNDFHLGFCLNLPLHRLGLHFWV